MISREQAEATFFETAKVVGLNSHQIEHLHAAAVQWVESEKPRRGKCEWCGAQNVEVKTYALVSHNIYNYGREKVPYAVDTIDVSPCCAKGMNDDGIRTFEIVGGNAKL